MRLVIVGGGPGALAAARGYREAGGDGDVTMVTRELVLPYMRPALSKQYLRGELAEEELLLEPPEWYAEHGIGVVLGRAMTAVDDGVLLDDGTTLPFDACILATGAHPKRLFDGPLTLRSLQDAQRLRGLHRDVTVIGSGFIGCEAAASLAMTGHRVTLVTDEEIPHQARLGEQAGRRIAAWLEDCGVTLRTGEEATEGTLMAVGVESERIPVDAGMRTSREHVYAMASTRRAWSTTATAPSPSTTARGGTTVGVLTHERDEDYERARLLVETGAPLP
jgi:NADPH-dependent 2,4-dienoyl-CoA reductase/sulfur reductase-like enzyme